LYLRGVFSYFFFFNNLYYLCTTTTMQQQRQRRNRNNRRNRPQQHGGAGSLVSPRNFNSHRVVTSDYAFPEYTGNPSVQKVQRVAMTLDADSATFNITPFVLTASDQADYASSGPRYFRVRAISIRVYLSSADLDPTAVLTVTDQDNFKVSRQANPGATILSVGSMASVARRASPYLSSDEATTLWQISLATTGETPTFDVVAYAFVLCQFS
jgi:hypothetical protein